MNSLMYLAIRSSNVTTTKSVSTNSIVVISFAVLKKNIFRFYKIKKCVLWNFIHLQKKKILKSLDQQKIYKINWNFFNGNESKQTDTWSVKHVNKDYLIAG